MTCTCSFQPQLGGIARTPRYAVGARADPAQRSIERAEYTRRLHWLASLCAVIFKTE